MFVVKHERQVLLDLSHLKVLVPDGDYLLAMKILAFRPETSDTDDVMFLIGHLGLRSVEEVVKIVQTYYPKKIIKPATVFRLEELFEQ
jgi:hypothetical protein